MPHWPVLRISAPLRAGAGSPSRAGYEDTPQVAQAISYLREFALQQEDAYGLALAANALAAYDPKGGSLY